MITLCRERGRDYLQSERLSARLDHLAARRRARAAARARGALFAGCFGDGAIKAREALLEARRRRSELRRSSSRRRRSSAG